MRQRGFTLLEVLVAVAVLGLLLGLLTQGITFGLQAVAMQSRQAHGDADLPTIDATLRRLIAQADPGIFPEPASLEGTAASLSLRTTLHRADGGAERIDATLLAGGGRLRLRWTPHRHVARFAPPPQQQELVLLDGVSGLRLAYAAPGRADWFPAWTGDALPALVRLQIDFRLPGRHWPPIIVAPRLEPVGQ